MTSNAALGNDLGQPAVTFYRCYANGVAAFAVTARVAIHHQPKDFRARTPPRPRMDVNLEELDATSAIVRSVRESRACRPEYQALPCPIAGPPCARAGARPTLSATAPMCHASLQIDRPIFATRGAELQ
jgi:hypothetical protein